MKRFFAVVLALFAGLLFGGAVFSADLDLSGTWNFTISNTQVSGPCPVGPNSSGVCTITQTGDQFRLAFVEGRICRPASLCTYEGTISGKEYNASNSAHVDNEGGKVTNTIVFNASSANAASGNGTSTYSHPGGMKCDWRFDFSIQKQ